MTKEGRRWRELIIIIIIIISYSACADLWLWRLIYMLRTLGPVSFLNLSVFSTCILVRSSSFVSGFVRSPVRVLLPDLSVEKKRSWDGGGEWLEGINGIHGCGPILDSAPVLPPLRPLSYFLLISPIPTCYLFRPHSLSIEATLV